MPKRLLRIPKQKLSLKYFPSKLCILSQHEVRFRDPCAAEMLVDTSPFHLFPDTSLFLNLSSSIHLPRRTAITILGS